MYAIHSHRNYMTAVRFVVCFEVQCVSYEKTIMTGTESIEDAAKFRRPVSMTGKANASTVRE